MTDALPFDLLSQDALARPADGAQVLVCFLRGYLPYTMGDIAGFAPVYAKRLIDAGLAAEVAADDAPAPAHGGEPAQKSGGKGRAAKPRNEPAPEGTPDADNP